MQLTRFPGLVTAARLLFALVQHGSGPGGALRCNRHARRLLVTCRGAVQAIRLGKLSMLTSYLVLGAWFAQLLWAPAGATPGEAQAGMEPLPAPTGPHKTGRMSFHWKDAARAEIETRAPEDKRELMVHLFYPADEKFSGARALYVPDAEAMRGKWNEEQIARIMAMRAFSLENAPLPRGTARYPVVLFAPGGGMKTLT